MSAAQIQRTASMLAPPVKLPRAFNNPDQVLSLIEKGEPYKTITAVQKTPPNNNTPGWFRNFWALGGKVVFEGAEEAFYNPHFIEAAKQSFQAEIIEPLAMMTNLNIPAPESPVHMDLPFFRGAHQREVPGWMLAPMGYSGLFQEWAIPVASAISWFYEGSGGDFEYWPNGLDEPSSTVSPPYSNTSVVADNEYMYHRVGQMGSKDDYLEDGISSEARLHRKSTGWEIRLGDELIRVYGDDEVRISILWKAFCFKDRQAADAFHNPAYNLTPDMVVDLFNADMKKNGVNFKEPEDIATDKQWMSAILDNYNSPDGSAY
jgi:hypothetical protein